jgi:hypothetical protein
MSNTLNLGTDGNWGVKKDSLLGYNSENGNFKPLPFDFTRASSGTVVNKDGLIERVGSGEPRIDFKDNTKGALLLEPQRTNLVTNSELLNTYFTTKSSGAVITDNYGISPNGLQNSSRIQLASSDYCLRGLSLSTNSTSSVYVKGIIGETIQFGVGANIAQGGIFTFNGFWQRIEYTYQNGSGSILFSNLQGSATATDFEAFGLQVEDNVTYATSYIPTSGSTVTRVADVSSQTVPDGVIGQTEGTMFVDFNIKTGQGIGGIIELINPSDVSSRVLLWDATALNNNINLVAFFSAKSSSITLNNVSIGNHKAVLIYSNSFTKFFLDGVKIGEQASNNPYSNMNKIDFNHTSGGVNFQQKTIKDVKLYNNALTDQEAIALTTI